MTWIKLAFALIGVAIWGYGTQTGDRNLQWGGIAIVLIAFLLRFVGRRREPPAG